MNQVLNGAGSAAKPVGQTFPPKAPPVQTFNLCSGCQKNIEEGDVCYHCADCETNFDLCQSCADSGLTSKHQNEKGHNHIFSVETKVAYYAQNAKGDTLEETLKNTFKFYSTRQAFGRYIPSRNRYEYMTYAELKVYVEKIAFGLQRLMSGSPDSMVALCSNASLGWYVTDLACALLAKPTVAITIGTDEESSAFILNQSECSTLVCSASALPIFSSLVSTGECPYLRHIIVMDLKEGGIDEAVLQGRSCGECQLLFLSELLNSNNKKCVSNLWERTHDPNSIFTIAYTSGSTGSPKGCVVSRKNWNAGITKLIGRLMKVWFSFQPPSHSLERKSIYQLLVGGGKSGIFRGDMEHLFADIAMIRPTVVASTPRFFSHIYDRYKKALQAVVLAGHQQAVTEQQSVHKDARKLPDNVEANGGTTQILSEDKSSIGKASKEEAENRVAQLLVSEFNHGDVPAELKKKVMESFRGILGGREKMLCLGGAAVSQELKTFLLECFRVMVIEAYGTTEVGGISLQDTVGPDVEFKLVDVPEMGYFTTDNPPRGEIYVKTSEMIEEYYKNPTETLDKFVDGYFCTGDIGLQYAPRKITIIDRKNNLFKLAQGEFVAPERIEGMFENQSSLIAQSYIYGSGLWTGVAAVIVPHADSLMQWCRINLPSGKGPYDMETLCSLEVVKVLFLSELRRIGQSQGLRPWEIPVAVLLEPEPFSPRNRLLTPLMKRARPKLENRYRTRLEELYSNLSSAQGGRSIEQQVLDCFKSMISATENLGAGDDNSTPNEGPMLDLSLTLSQLGGDSLAATRLSFLLQESFSVSFSARELLRACLGDILKQVLLKKGLPASLPSIKVLDGTFDWEAEADISFLEKEVKTTASLFTMPELPKETVFLLTGATGFLGRFVLWELVNQDYCGLVYCLSRRNKSDSAEERVKALLRQIHSELKVGSSEMPGMPSLESVMAKVVVVEGDISQARFGLSVQLYKQMAAEVAVVIHAASQVNFVLPYEALKDSNVRGTKEALLFCTRGRSKFLHYTSTVGVFDQLPKEVITEIVPPPSDGLKHLPGYSQSKWVSERLVLKAANSRLVSACVSRSGLIGAHSQTGHLNAQDRMYWLAAGVAKLGCYPTGPGWSDGGVLIVPVDVTARAVLFLTLQSLGKRASIYHITNDDKASAVQHSDLFKALSSFVSLRAMDYKEFRSLLRTKSRESPEDVVLASFDVLLPPSGLLPQDGVFGSMMTRDVLANGKADINLTGIKCDYPKKYVQYLKTKYL